MLEPEIEMALACEMFMEDKRWHDYRFLAFLWIRIPPRTVKYPATGSGNCGRDHGILCVMTRRTGTDFADRKKSIPAAGGRTQVRPVRILERHSI